MKKKIQTIMINYKYVFYFFLFCLFIAIFLNQSCIFNDYDDYDPLFGGYSGQVCSFGGSFLKIITHTFGLFWFGYISKYFLGEFKSAKP